VRVLRSYRLHTKTLVLRKGVTCPIATSLPAESILRVAEDFLDASGLVEVEWEGETVRIFAVDLGDRGEFIQAMSAAGDGR
jgi:hypothetical protein